MDSVNFDINGIEDLVKSFQDLRQFINPPEVSKLVHSASIPLSEQIKQNYISKGHYKTGKLVNSIMGFDRRRKGETDPFFTTYVGPKYGKGTGGNLAHLLEYGTVERYRANVSKGGVSVSRRVYGAKASTGRINPPTIGVIRLSYDQKKSSIENELSESITNSIVNQAKKNGYK